MTQDAPEAQTRKDFEEDCDAVNQARASKNNDSGYSAYQRVYWQESSHRWKMLFWSAEKQIRGSVSRQQTGELAQERLITMRLITLQASPALDHKRRWKRALYHAAKHHKGELHVGQPPLPSFGDVEQMQSKKPTNAFLAPGRGYQQHVYHSLDSPPRFRNQVCKIPSATVSRPMTRRHANTSRNT